MNRYCVSRSSIANGQTLHTFPSLLRESNSVHLFAALLNYSLVGSLCLVLKRGIEVNEKNGSQTLNLSSNNRELIIQAQGKGDEIIPVDQITSIASLSADEQTHSYEVGLVTTTGQKTFKVFSPQHYAAVIDGLGGLLQQAFVTDKVKSEYNVLFQAIQYAKQLEPAVPDAPPSLPQ